MDIIGKGVTRKDAWEKVTGQAIYTGDREEVKILHVKKVISPYAHALIKNINLIKA
jgi:CO/xanthine dehydrogenase Mo-binding subunit